MLLFQSVFGHKKGAVFRQNDSAPGDSAHCGEFDMNAFLTARTDPFPADPARAGPEYRNNITPGRKRYDGGLQRLRSPCGGSWTESCGQDRGGPAPAHRSRARSILSFLRKQSFSVHRVRFDIGAAPAVQTARTSQNVWLFARYPLCGMGRAACARLFRADRAGFCRR